jgi:hypothetical protein
MQNPKYPGMKMVVFYALAILTTSTLQGQPTGKPIRYVDIQPVDSTLKKETLYSNALEWVGMHFNNANRVIQVQDKEIGLLIVKGNFDYLAPGGVLDGAETRTISFMLKFSLKDFKYKLEIFDFTDPYLGQVTDGDYETTSSLSKKLLLKQWKTAQDETQSHLVAMIKSIKESMIKEGW